MQTPQQEANRIEQERVDQIYDRREKLDEMFVQLVASDCDRRLEQLVDEYEHCIPAVQGLINYMMIALCGYSLPTIAAKAMSDEPDEVESDGFFPYTDPQMVTAATDLGKPMLDELHATMRANIEANREATP